MAESHIRGEDLERYSKAFDTVSWIELQKIPTGYAYGRLTGALFDVGKGGAWRSFGATSAAVMLRVLTETLLIEKFVRPTVDEIRQAYVPEVYRVEDLMERETGVSFFPHPLYLTQNADEKDFLYYYMVATPEERRALETFMGLEEAAENALPKTAFTLLHLAFTGVYAAKVAVDSGLGSAIFEGLGAFLYGPTIALGIEAAKDEEGGSRG